MVVLHTALAEAQDPQAPETPADDSSEPQPNGVLPLAQPALGPGVVAKPDGSAQAAAQTAPATQDADGATGNSPTEQPQTRHRAAARAAFNPSTLASNPPPSSEQPGARSLSYTLEAVEVRGNDRTRATVVLRFIPFEPGSPLDPADPAIELARYRLLGTGFFRDVQFSLEKGSQRGRVRLVVEVVERNTIIVNDVWMGLSADAETTGKPRPLTAYAGLDVSETNLGGSGVTLGTAFGLSENQYGLRVRYLDPSLFGSSWMIGGSLLYNDATDFFGNADVVWVSDYTELLRRFAIVKYKRFGGVVGLGRDLNPSTQLWGHYRIETLDVNLPGAAAHVRGGVLEPITYDVLPGHSILSTVRATLQHDTRDHPFLPTKGWFTTVTAEMGIPRASDYEYQRFDVSARHWWKLPWHGHVFGLNGFAGVVAGEAPFFEQYYIGDFTDFLPGRMLGLRFDRRPPPDFLDTAIREVRYGHYAFQLSGEYRLPLYRGRRAVYGIDLFTSLGIWGLAHKRDLTNPPRSYSGASLVPVDLTANLGFRMDTSAGGLVVSFSNVLGFVPVRGNEGP